MDVIVVGAGIAGSSMVRALRAAGHDVDHVAAPAFAVESRACAAILRRAYHARERGQRALYDRTLNLYRQWGVPVAEGGWVTEPGGRTAYYDRDWGIVHPAVPLVPADRQAIATPTSRGVRLDDGTQLHADRVIWCCGAHTAPFRDLGDPPAVRYGVTWIHASARALTQPDRIRVHRFTPYKIILAGATVSNGARLGTTSASTLDRARQHADTMLAEAIALRMIRSADGWTPVAGSRISHGTLADAVHLTGPHWGFDGLNQSGYALAPALAERVAPRILAGP